MLAEIQSIALRNARFETAPAKLPDTHELNYTVNLPPPPGQRWQPHASDGAGGTPVTGAACAIMNCGAKLNDFELKMHNGRKNRALKITVVCLEREPPPVSRALYAISFTVTKSMSDFTCQCTDTMVRQTVMLYIVMHGSEVVGVMTSPVDAHLIAKPLGAQIWTCQPNSTDATLLRS